MIRKIFFIYKENNKGNGAESDDIPDVIFKQIPGNYVDQIPHVVTYSSTITNITPEMEQSDNTRSSHPPLDENVLQYLFKLEEHREHNESSFDWVIDESRERWRGSSLIPQSNIKNNFKDGREVVLGCRRAYSHSESSADEDFNAVKNFKRLYKFNPKPLVEKPSMKRHRHKNIDAMIADPEYMEKRRKNNEASRRSRLARRYKECLVVEEMNQLREENKMLKERIQRLKELGSPSLQQCEQGEPSSEMKENLNN